MDYSTIIQIVGSLGFPIAACFAMGYYIVKTDANNREMIMRVENLHNTQLDKMTKAINNNTEAVKDLASVIELRSGDANG